MADSKLRLQIVTALDNAGIKATKEQVESLNKTLSKTGDGNKLGEIERTIGKMEGPLDKLQELFEQGNGAIAKFGVKALAVLAAFKAGWDIGEWINEKVINPLFSITDPIEELKKRNRELRAEYDKATEAFVTASQKFLSNTTNNIQSLDKEIGNIEKLRQAWNRLNKAKTDYYNSNQDIEIQILERERFEDILKLQEIGDFEGADQMNALYDFYRKQLEAKKAIATFDNESLSLEKRINDEQEKRLKLNVKFQILQSQYARLNKERTELDTNNRLGYNEQEYNKLVAENEKQKQAIKAQIKAIKNDIQLSYKESRALEIDAATRENNRLILSDRLNLDIDRAALNYDNITAEYGNPLGIQFHDDYLNQLSQNSIQSYDALVKAISDGISEGVGTLLEAK